MCLNGYVIETLLIWIFSGEIQISSIITIQDLVISQEKKSYIEFIQENSIKFIV